MFIDIESVELRLMPEVNWGPYYFKELTLFDKNEKPVLEAPKIGFLIDPTEFKNLVRYKDMHANLRTKLVLLRKETEYLYEALDQLEREKSTEETKSTFKEILMYLQGGGILILIGALLL
jgi:hypothetical protein